MTSNRSSRDRVEAAFELREEPDRIKSYYGDWASSYNEDVSAENYVAPGFIAALVARFTDEPGRAAFRCLDAGCGTGLVGVELRKLGFETLTGSDISAEMAEIADQTGAYHRTIAPVDLNHPLAAQLGADAFDVTVCCGVFTLGHVPPDALHQLHDVTAASGLIALSARTTYAVETGFEQYIAEFTARSSSDLLYCETAPYVGEDTALYAVIRTA